MLNVRTAMLIISEIVRYAIGLDMTLSNHKKVAWTTFLLFILIAFLASSVLITFSNASVGSKHLISSSGTIGLNWLRTKGKQIVDSNGNAVIWHGVNVHDPRFRPLNEEDYERIAGWGVKIVRMPIEWNQIEPMPGVYDLSYFGYIDNQIEYAGKYGIYIILNVHQAHWSPYFTYGEGLRGYGFPIWSVSNYPNNDDGFLDAITDFWLGKGPNGTIASPTNPSMIDRYISLWKFIALRYINNTTVAVFDLFNEPPRGRITTNEEHAPYLYSFYEKLVSEIRKVDSNRILSYQPSFGWYTKVAQRLNDSNIALSFHFYCLKDNYDGNKSRLEYWFLQSFSWVKDWNIPIWIGEVGIENFRSNLDLWINDVLTMFRTYNVGWSWYVCSKSNAGGYFLLYANGTEKLELTTTIKAYF